MAKQQVVTQADIDAITVPQDVAKRIFAAADREFREHLRKRGPEYPPSDELLNRRTNV